MANSYNDFSLSFSHFVNPNSHLGSDYEHQDILSLDGFRLANKEITSWDNYLPTPLHSFDDMAQDTGVSSIFYKDENPRFTLKSFKALGGAYAVANLLIKKLKEEGINANSSDLISGKYKEYTSNLTVCCATDGNHGRSVAWGAKQFGCKCEIYIHRNVSQGREKAIAKYGATVNRIKGNYDDSVRIAAEVAESNGYTVVSDNEPVPWTETLASTIPSNDADLETPVTMQVPV